MQCLGYTCAKNYVLNYYHFVLKFIMLLLFFILCFYYFYYYCNKIIITFKISNKTLVKLRIVHFF